MQHTGPKEPDDVRAQASIEYMATYGWAILIIAIMLSVLYFYINISSQVVTNTCYFTSNVYCNEIVVFATNTMTRNTVIALYLTNLQQYPLINASLYVHFKNVNTTAFPCYPKFIPPGGYISCATNLPVNAMIGTFFSGDLYLNATYCTPTYLQVNSSLYQSIYQSATFPCLPTNALLPPLNAMVQNTPKITTIIGQNQTSKGSFTGHTQLIAPAKVSFTPQNFTYCSSGGSNIIKINALNVSSSFNCNQLTSSSFSNSIYNSLLLGTLISYSFSKNIPVSSGTREAFRNVFINNVYLPSNSASIIVAGNMKFTFNYNVQYLLNVISQPNCGGNMVVSPVSGWYNASSTITISEKTKGADKFKSWLGTGPGHYTGTNRNPQIIMNGSITETAVC